MVREQSLSPRDATQSLVLLAALVALSILFLFPLYWMIATALKDEFQNWAIPTVWVPAPPTLENLAEVFRMNDLFPFGRYFINTLYVCGLGAIGVVFGSSLPAYAFARLQWKGREAALLITISTIMLPPVAYIVPRYMIFRSLGMVGTFMPMWVPFVFGTAFHIYLFTQFFRGIPSELSDAGIMDGCTHLRLYANIVMPLSINAAVTVLTLHFVTVWKDLVTPLVYFNRREMFTLSLGLKNLMSHGGTGNLPLGVGFAAAVLVSLPLVLFFFMFQKYLTAGLSLGGVKA